MGGGAVAVTEKLLRIVLWFWWKEPDSQARHLVEIALEAIHGRASKKPPLPGITGSSLFSQEGTERIFVGPRKKYSGSDSTWSRSFSSASLKPL
jgi:hypothetical protein